MAVFDPLSALAAIERRFDGPVPDEARRTAMDRGMKGAAAAQSALFDRLARHAASALARSRGGTPQREAQLIRDLRLYRQAGIIWRDKAGAQRQG